MEFGKHRETFTGGESYLNIGKILGRTLPVRAGEQASKETLMADYAPFTLRIVDDQGKELFSQSVPFEAELDVRGVMERAFILSQTAAAPDPFF